ncbi:MAG: HD domain-containing phosphohydrolase [Geminicoccaceae bacterium]
MNEAVDPLTPEDAPAPPSVGRFLVGAALCVALGLAAATFSVGMVVKERRAAIEQQLEQRLAAEAGGKVELVETWIGGLASLGNRLLRSDLVRLFVTELEIGSEDAELSEALAAQRPYMRQVLDDLAREHDLRGAYLVARDGSMLLGDLDAPVLGGEQSRRAAGLVADGGDLAVGPPRLYGERYYMDVLQPIGPAQSYSGGPAAVGVLLMSFDVTDMLEKLLASHALIDRGSSTLLAVYGEDGWRQITVDATGLAEQPFDATKAESGERAAMGLDAGLYRLMLPADKPGWLIEQRMDETVASAPVRQFEKSAFAFASAAGIILALVFASFFWRLQSRHHAAMATQYRKLAERIHAQNDLLRTVTDRTLDLIALKAVDGRYELVSRSFAHMFERAPEGLEGMSDAGLFEADTCARLAEGEREAMAVGVSSRDDIVIRAGGSERHMHVVQVPVGEKGEDRKILMVARDITDLVQARADRERLSRQTVDAFVRAVELVDPYLEGHTQRLSALTEMLGRELVLEGDDARTLSLAAGLSQIGKMFVPREIVAKPDRHTEEEARIMRTHIDHARRVLDSIQFGLPVADAVSQMHERLDGSGYPHELSGDAIGNVGRILAVADVYCARTSPRSYREHLEPAAVIHHLRNAGGRYDETVIDALERIVADGHKDDAQPGGVGNEDIPQPSDTTPIEA